MSSNAPYPSLETKNNIQATCLSKVKVSLTKKKQTNKQTKNRNKKRKKDRENIEKETERKKLQKSEPRMGFEPTTLRYPFGCSSH